mgnify:CR=1 FL=1
MNMAKKYDVIVVGELNVDLILNKIDKFPVIGKEVLADQMTLTLGSSSAIFASNLQTLGTSVTYIGKLGIDDFGDYISSALKNKGVDTKNIIRSSNHNTGATIVLNFQEDRAMVTYPGAMSSLSIQDISDEALLSSKHLHVSSIFLQQGLKPGITKLLKKAKELGLTTSLDPQWDPAEKWDIDLGELLEYVDVFMPNVTELKAIIGTNDFDIAIKSIMHSNKITVVKDGNNGAYLCKGNKMIHQPAFLNADVADSIGAGDSFNAGFIHYYIQDKPEKDCLEFGALIGAVNTTHSGGIGAFESLEQVLQITKSTFNFSI